MVRIRRFVLWSLALLLGCEVFAGDDEAATAGRLENRIQWSTASEVNNFGYDVYRGESRTGPFVKLTETPLPGAGTEDTPQSYDFVDDTIAPDTIYYYYVESISMDGVRKRLTPTIPSRPKSRPGP